MNRAEFRPTRQSSTRGPGGIGVSIGVALAVMVVAGFAALATQPDSGNEKISHQRFGSFRGAESTLDAKLEQLGHRQEGYPAISRASKQLAMGFTVRGIVNEVLVRETDHVEPDQPLIRLKDDLQYWTTEVSRIAAEDDSDLQDARRQLELAEYDLDSLKNAEKKGAVSPRELVHAEAQFAGAKTHVEATELAHEQAVANYKREKARLDEMTIRSTISGVVVGVHVEPGEAIEELEPAIDLVSLDPLWMDVAVPVQLGMKLKPGMPAIVQWRDISAETPIDATVKHILPVADAASNSIVTRIEIDNPSMLPAGLHAYVQFPEAEEAWRQEVANSNGHGNLN